MFIAGHPANAGDFLYRDNQDPSDRERVSVEFKPVANSRLSELAANFDIVLGVTPQDPADPQQLIGDRGIGKSQRAERDSPVGIGGLPRNFGAPAPRRRPRPQNQPAE